MSLDFLEKFLEKNTPSGQEKIGQVMWAEEARKYAKVTTDVTGNVIATLSTDLRATSTTVMLAGHCDEIGVIVTYITDDGYAHFAEIGGVDLELLQGTRIVFEKCTGVIGKRPVHLSDEDDEKKILRAKNLWIDIGAKNKKQTLEYLPIGSMGCVSTGVHKLLNGLITCKGIDNKVGSYAVLRALEKIHKKIKKLTVKVVVVSTVQEEIGLYGAKVSAYGIRPDAAIAVDVSFATDTPEEDDKKICGDVRLGRGPIIAVGPTMNNVLRNMLIKSAEKHKIEVQHTAEPAGYAGTDADSIRLSRGGVATTLVSIPTRYIHTPVEVCSLDDIEKTATLIAETLLSMPAKPDFSPF